MDTIDAKLKDYYSKDKYSELQALYGLIHKSALASITSELEKTLQADSKCKQCINISYRWIDKIPLAKFKVPQCDFNGNSFTEKVEIGDMAIRFRRYAAQNNRGSIITSLIYDTGTIFQAKVSNIDYPSVPVVALNKHKATSTSKELVLLEKWPKFDLYKTAATKIPKIVDVNINNDDSKKAFFGVFSNIKKEWKFGEAKYGNECNMNYSSLLYGICKNRIGKNVDDDPEWKKLFTELDFVCSEYNMPHSICNSIMEKRSIDTTYTNYLNKVQFMLSSLGLGSRRMFLAINIDQISIEEGIDIP